MRTSTSKILKHVVIIFMLDDVIENSSHSTRASTGKLLIFVFIFMFDVLYWTRIPTENSMRTSISKILKTSGYYYFHVWCTFLELGKHQMRISIIAVNNLKLVDCFFCVVSFAQFLCALYTVLSLNFWHSSLVKLP